MIVRCVQILGTATGKPLNNHPGIRIGSDYPVLEVYANQHGLKFRIFNPEIGPHGIAGHALWGAGMFEMVSVKIPSRWIASISLQGQLTLAPSAWLYPNFWDEFFDGASNAIDIFDREVKFLLAEA
jgi:hypothetical protein